MKKIFAIVVAAAVLSGCATTVTIKRLAPAQYDITGIKSVGFDTFDTRLNSLKNSGEMVTAALEASLEKNGFFTVSPRLNSGEEPIAQIRGKKILRLDAPLDVDAEIRGEVTTCHVDKQRSKKRVERQVKKDDKTVMEVGYEPYVIKHATLSFSLEVKNRRTGNIIGQDTFKGIEDKDAQGESNISFLPSDDTMLNNVMSELANRFVDNIAPHPVAYKVTLEKVKLCNDANKQAKKGDWDNARLCWEGSIEPQALYNIGVGYEVFAHYDKALEYFSKAAQHQNNALYVKAMTRAKSLLDQQNRLKKQLGR